MAASKPILYSAWISSCSFRVRIALNLKGVDYEYRAVTWTDPDYEKINPIKYVPAFVDGDFVVSDSLAIIFYLEDKYPQHPLLPQDLKKKAINLQIANIGLLDGKLDSDESLHIVQHYIDKGFRGLVNCTLLLSVFLSLHIVYLPPHHNKWCLLVTHDKYDLCHHISYSCSLIVCFILCWTNLTFLWIQSAIEKLLEGCDSKYATGDEIQLADVFLAPQIHAGVTRFQIDMSKYPLLERFYKAYMEIPAVQIAIPEKQPDAPPPPGI